MTRTKLASILLFPRSLLVVKDEFYQKYLHGIEEQKEDEVNPNLLNWDSLPGEIKSRTITRGIRVSVTIRHVLHTRRINISLLCGR